MNEVNVSESDDGHIAEASDAGASLAEAVAPTDDQTDRQPLVIERIDVTYFTPSQQEGPYYPLDKPVDRDHDLIVLTGAAGLPAGMPLEFDGRVYDASGMPLQGIVVEIWQTDSNGAYDHPNDPASDGRDQTFQFYGESTTTADGRYEFRTIMPGRYEPRPVHIHVKLKAEGQELLTTQFYFEGDRGLAGEGLTGGDNVHMIMNVTNGLNDVGDPILIGERDVVLRLELPDHYPHEEAQIGAGEPVDFASDEIINSGRINLNAMTQDELLSTIPDFGPRMVREFFEYQPYISIQQFRREIGKYVDEAQIAVYEQYVFVPVDVDEADAETLIQMPGVDATMAGQLIDARPYGSNEAFLDELARLIPEEQLAAAAPFLTE